MSQPIVDPASLPSYYSRSALPAKLLSVFLAAFITITMLAIIVPLNPEMPDKGITPLWISAINQARSNSQDQLPFAKFDQSWIFAINEAAARHLRFGKEIIFTFGPYASIFTRSFHPGTDRLMILGSLLLGISYVIALLYLTRGRRLYMTLALMLFLATFPSRDSLLFSYPFLLVICGLKFEHSPVVSNRRNLSWKEILLTATTFSALGLLPLIKGSLLFPAIVCATVLFALLLYRCQLKQAIPLMLVPIFATLAFWVFAGQKLIDLPAFLHNTLLLTSGYTDAMSNSWQAWPPLIGNGVVVAYMVISALIYVSLMRSSRLKTGLRWLLGFVCAPFLLVAFKHGFVRADHVAIAFNSLALMILMISLLYTDKYLISALLIVIFLVGVIYSRYDPVLVSEVKQHFGSGTSTSRAHRKEILALAARMAVGTLSRVTYQSTANTYADAWIGIRSRITDRNGLQSRFIQALANIGREYSVPVLKGSLDIYTYEQSLVLASSDDWNPRPIFQSYSAYTPALARLNEQHLRTANAPDWVLFDLVAIDGRLPSLEDGVSWPALLDNYTLTSFDGQFVLMHRNRIIQDASKFDVVQSGSYATGVNVPVPQASGPIFAEVVLKPTLLGKLLVALYKPPQLHMVLNLENGTTRTYRVVSNMMSTAFLVSPLVRDTREFASLAAGDQHALDEGKVQTISIQPSYGDSVLWSGTIAVTLKTYRGKTDIGAK